MFQSARLSKTGDGEANKAYWGFTSAENWLLSRFALQCEYDEKDLVVGANVNVILRAQEELGRAAGRLVPDLVYSLILKNPTMSVDGVALFHADHENLGNDSLDVQPLSDGMSAICSQVAPDDQGNSVHQNLTPKYLIVAPKLYAKARALVRFQKLDDANDLKVLAESRLGPTGLLDPNSEQNVVGSDSAWMLAADSIALPSIIIGALGGSLEPVVRQYDLAGPGQGAGRWGIGLDCHLDAGVTALDWRGLYFSAAQ
jgi:hypothetical protein